MPKRPGSPRDDAGPAYRDLLGRVAANVLRIRQRLGLTQEEAAHRANLTTRVYVRLEHQETNFTAITLARVAGAFGVDVSELVARGRRPSK